jgi:hypothetical protein
MMSESTWTNEPKDNVDGEVRECPEKKKSSKKREANSPFYFSKDEY